MAIRLILILFLFWSCEPKRNVLKVKDDNNDNLGSYPPPNTGSRYPDPTYPGGVTPPSGNYNNDDCYDPGVLRPGQDAVASDYIKDLPTLTLHPNTKDANGNVWSTATDTKYDGDIQSLFMTEKEFAVRVLAYQNPGSSSGDTGAVMDNYGNECERKGEPYTKLRVTLGIRSPGSQTNIAEYDFEAAVNGCSQVHRFNAPVGSNHVVVDIKNIEWDHTCNVQDNFHGNHCPYSFVWGDDCVKVRLQIATDLTKDFPAGQ